MGFSWSLFLAQSCTEEKSCLAPNPRRIGGDETTPLIHDRGPPPVFVTGEQEHGGAYVFVHNLGAMCVNVVLSQKMVLGWTEICELFGLVRHTWARVRHSGQSWTVASWTVASWTVASCPHG